VKREGKRGESEDGLYRVRVGVSFGRKCEQALVKRKKGRMEAERGRLEWIRGA
jgi:hypothetical protein